MVIDTEKLTKNWKTTTQGLLGAAIATIIAIMALPQGAKPIVIALAACRALVGFLQTDAK
jgi:hypothetical protein